MAGERERSRKYEHKNTTTRFTTAAWLKDLQAESQRIYARKPTQGELIDKYIKAEHKRVFGTIDEPER